MIRIQALPLRTTSTISTFGERSTVAVYFELHPLSESSRGGILPTWDLSSSLSSGYEGFLTNSDGLPNSQHMFHPLHMVTHQYGCFRHSLSSRTTLIISPSSLLSRSAKAVVSTTTYPPRLIHIWDRKREGSSTNNGFVVNGSSTEYRFLPSAFRTRAMA